MFVDYVMHRFASKFITTENNLTSKWAVVCVFILGKIEFSLISETLELFLNNWGFLGKSGSATALSSKLFLHVPLQAIFETKIVECHSLNWFSCQGQFAHKWQRLLLFYLNKCALIWLKGEEYKPDLHGREKTPSGHVTCDLLSCALCVLTPNKILKGQHPADTWQQYCRG